MTITGEFKQYGEIAAEQGKAALTEVRKSLYAALGAGDVLRAQAAEQRKQLAGRAQGLAQDLRVRAQEVPAQARMSPVELRRSVESYVQATTEQAVTVFTELSKRGEQVVKELRKDPRLQRVIIGTEGAVDTVEDALEDLLDEVDGDVKGVKRDVAEGAETARAGVRKVAARNTNARKSTSRKAPAAPRRTSAGRSRASKA